MLRWPPLESAGKTVLEATLWIRPQDFDEATSCPPALGVSPTDVLHAHLRIPLSRAPGTLLAFACVGEMRKLRLRDGGKAAEGAVRCGCDVNAPSPMWDTAIELPCEVDCPANFTLSRDGSRCYSASGEGDPMGYLGAARSCSEMGASLAVFAEPEDLQVLPDDLFYYTIHRSRNLNGWMRPSLPYYVLCPENGTCQPNGHNTCLTVNRNGTYVAQSCFSEDLRYVCMLPAYCPPGFRLYLGRCYRVSDMLFDSHLVALSLCENYGAALAFPESADALDFIARMILKKNLSLPVAGFLGLNRVNGSWSFHGLYNPDQEVRQLADASTGVWTALSVDVNSSVLIQSNLTGSGYHAFCQYPGPLGCWDDPPEALANMDRLWTNSSTALFMAPLNASLPTMPAGASVALDPDRTYEIGSTVGVFCEEGRMTPRGTANTTITLTVDGWSELDPNFTCLVACSGDPPAPPADATRDWGEEAVPLEGTEVTYNCSSPDQLFGNFNSSVSVTCKRDGNWSAVPPEDFLCRTPAPPDAALPPTPEGAVLVVNASDDSWVGSSTTYECEDGMTPQGTINTTITMTEEGWSELDPEFACYPVEENPPPTDLVDNGHLLLEDPPYWVNRTLVFECVGLMTSPTGETNTTVVYTLDGWQLTDPEFACYNASVLPENATLLVGDPPYSVGDTGSLVCDGDMVSGSGEASTTVTYTQGGWIMEDVEFDCYEIITDAPPPPLDPSWTVEGNENPSLAWEGKTLTLHCAPYAYNPNGEDSTTLTYTQSEWVLADPDFECVNVSTALPSGATLVGPPPPYEEGQILILECANYTLSAKGENNTQVTYTEAGWIKEDPDFECYKMLEGAQPPPSGNGWIVEDDNPNLIWEGKTLTIRCGPNQYNPNGENSSTITYSGSEWVQADPHFVCVNVSASSILPTGATLVGADPPYTEGQTATLECEEGKLSAKGKSSTIVTFTHGEWVMDDPDFDCFEMLEDAELPSVEGNWEIIGDDNPSLIWEGKKLTIRCSESMYNPEGDPMSSITYSGSEWVQDDPDFDCIKNSLYWVGLFALAVI
ncbi:putative complement factor H-related protein 4 isoform X2 [Penaeus vannamei]|uniref:Putative complement factor H-related protein 4 isoform X2 n=1 Tax=Penaeus vannamei TaxID=6689 RepID=A0A423TY20_PENVA|nr:putative complement factor H-related protein 4 isoform X2 [Penaeus vannamei]